LGRCEAYADVEHVLRQLADREIARLGVVQAWHGEVTAGDSDRFRDGRVITERLAHHAMMLPQLLDLPRQQWRGTIKGPKTAVLAEALRPLVEWVAEQLGDSAEGRMARWVDLAPRLTPAGTHNRGGAGRRLCVDPVDAALVISDRLPHPGFSLSVRSAYELVGPVVRDAAALQAFQQRIMAVDPHGARGVDSARASAWLDAPATPSDELSSQIRSWRWAVGSP